MFCINTQIMSVVNRLQLLNLRTGNAFAGSYIDATSTNGITAKTLTLNPSGGTVQVDGPLQGSTANLSLSVTTNVYNSDADYSTFLKSIHSENGYLFAQRVKTEQNIDDSTNTVLTFEGTSTTGLWASPSASNYISVNVDAGTFKNTAETEKLWRVIATVRQDGVFESTGKIQMWFSIEDGIEYGNNAPIVIAGQPASVISAASIRVPSGGILTVNVWQNSGTTMKTWRNNKDGTNLSIYCVN